MNQAKRSPAAPTSRAKQSNQHAQHNPLELILASFPSVRSAGDGYRADSPCGHSNARGSVAITEGDGGRVLLHDFAGHSAAEMLAAAGLSLADLYPDRGEPKTPLERRRRRGAWQTAGWRAALGVVANDAAFIYEVARWLRDESRPLPEPDMRRLRESCGRIREAREVLQ